MSTPFNSHTTKNLGVLALALNLPVQVQLLRFIREEAGAEFDKMYKADGVTHSIEGVGFSHLKTDSVKQYCEFLGVLVFNSQDGWQRGFSKNYISTVNDEALTFINRLGALTLTRDTLFRKVVTALFGYDGNLVDLAMSTQETGESDLVIRYLASRFDLSETVGDVPPEDPYFQLYPANTLSVLTEQAERLYGDLIHHIHEDSYDFFNRLLKSLRVEGAKTVNV